jgi:hypothetical protein
MSVMVTELYDALRKAGVDEQLARDAARAVLGYDVRNDLATKGDVARLEAATKADLGRLEAATKADLKVAIAELKADLIKWNVGAMAVLTAIFAAISRLG